MDDAVRVELETFLGHLRACRRTSDAVEAGGAPEPSVPGPAEYVRAMTWARVSGGFQVLETLGLITHAERVVWEVDGREIVASPHGRGAASVSHAACCVRAVAACD